VDLEITGRHLDVTEPMAAHIREHLDRMPAFLDLVQYMTVTLSVDSGSRHVEIQAKCPRADLVVEAASHDMYQSIDEAFAKMARRLARHHDKLVSGRAREAQQAAEAQKRPQ
jgi:putative sigma-54 modulation protein